MKSLNFLLVILILGLILNSCEKDEIYFDESKGEITQTQQRSFNQLDCGFASNFCESEPEDPPVVALVSNGDGGINVRVENENYLLYPYKLYDGSNAIIVNNGREIYVGHTSRNDYLLSKSIDGSIREQLNCIPSLDYEDDYSVENVKEKFEEMSILGNLGTPKNPVFDFTNVNGNCSISWVKECDVTLVSKVENFVSVFFDEGDASHIEEFIEDAFNSCPPAYPDFQSDIPNRCLNFCIDPRCVVDHLLDMEDGLSEFQKRVLISRYLQESMGLTDEEQNWLTLNDQSELISSIYNGLLSNQNLGRCENEDCGLAGGYHEIIKQGMKGKTLTSSESTELLEFFSVMSCDDPSIYSCFRESQQNPDSEMALFIENVLTSINDNRNTLVDDCAVNPDYTERWTYLANLDASGIQAVKDRLAGEGDYANWVQTLDNATSGVLFINNNPSVNLDFFGVNISVLPINPDTGEQFETASEFFNYVQTNFATADFYGEGSPCSNDGGVEKFFEFDGPEDEVIFASENPVGTIFTIKLPDDGSVILSEAIPGQSFIFSTLNAPGWFITDDVNLGSSSWDGYHPVSGNREFGIIENPDGTFTFYTSGVDRVSTWWHALGEGAAFSGADDFWVCFMETIFFFVEINGGEASANFDCITIRPVWEEVKESLRRGCQGDIEELEEFLCDTENPCG